jgi:serine/threonine protein kinase
MIGQVLNHRYEILEKVGEGGMAVAYRGRDRVLGRTVAVKVMRPELSTDAEFLARFRREARASAGITHAHIASVYDTGSDGPSHYIVMEYVEGESLRDRLKREGPLPLPEALRITAETAEALEAAHAAGIVHRDIKPGNLLLKRDGAVKVTDFGIARAMSASGHTETGRIVGSVNYVSPEQARGDVVGPQSDLYSLGVTLFEMLTGRPPFDAGDRLAVLHQHIYDHPPLVSDFRSGLPEEAVSIIEHCLEKDLSLRFASAREVHSYLVACPRTEAQGWRRSLRGLSPLRRLSHLSNDVGWWLQRRMVWVSVILVLSSAALIGGALWYSLARSAGLSEVPDLIGMSARAARTQIETMHLEYREIGSKPSEDVEAGAVLSQDPRPGFPAPRGAVVKVVISQGTDQVVVPDVSEMALAQAELNLRAAGLSVDSVREDYDERIPKGYVRSTRPGPGVKVVKGTAVDLEVSLGTKPTAVVTPPPPAPPTPGGGRRETVSYRVPQDGAPEALVKVTVELDDARGRRTIYEGYHRPDESIPPQTFSVSGPTTIRILVNGTLREELAYQP